MLEPVSGGTRRRVAITGLGTVNPCGNDMASTWRSVLEGRSGIGPISRFDASTLESRIGGAIQAFDASRYLTEKEQSRCDLFIQYAVAAAAEAMASSGLIETRLEPEDREMFGVMIGSGLGGLGTVESSALAPRLSGMFYPATLVNLASGQVSIKWDLRGPSGAVSTACATGAHAIGDAARLIMHGYATRMLAGATEAPLSRLGVGGFDALRALSRRNTEPARASRPFDRDRDGFVISEGAAVLVLEEYESARARGAPILAEIVGYGSSSDAHHVTAPRPDGAGAASAMRRALADARVAPSQVGYLNAHGTSTQLGDRVECQAIRSVFGADTQRLKVSSTKSTTGHLLGAAGALELALCALALRARMAPPTINVENLDPACELDVTPNVPSRIDSEYALSNNFAFGGLNASILLKAHSR
ncbi:MAG TPA: beta-ketoacyl-ACP synthase II [Polyangiaceae bacterium]|nr:beta-ketoacyl-ACP synthase II [Polyangiaceae bacterium]